MNPKKLNILKTRLGRITTEYGGSTRNEPRHMAVDVANAPGTPIPALTDGVVTAVGKTNNGFGKVVQISDGKGGIQQYAHLMDSMVKPGMRVKRGQRFARMGDSGNAYSPSGGNASHVDVRFKDANGRPQDPTPYIRNIA